MYTKVMELNYWGSTNASAPVTTRRHGEWTVDVERDGAEVTLRPQQLVLATGMSARAADAQFPGWTSSRATSTIRPASGTRRATGASGAVVIGSNNSAHDICAALWEGGADVTMVQRSPTHVVRSDT